MNKLMIEKNKRYWVPYWHKGRYLAREEYLNFIKDANLEIKVVCGQCNPVFYDSPEFIDSIKKLIEGKQGNVSIAFNKDSTSKDEAERSFKEKNTRLFEYFNSLNQPTKERFELIWLMKKLSQQYLIIDRENLILEGKHEDGEPREIYCVLGNILKNKKMAEQWLSFYNKLIDKKGQKLFNN